MASLLKILKNMSYCLGRTLRQVVLHDGEIPGVLLYWPLLISFLNQIYFSITNTYFAVLPRFGQINPERNNVSH